MCLVFFYGYNVRSTRLLVEIHNNSILPTKKYHSVLVFLPIIFIDYFGLNFFKFFCYLNIAWLVHVCFFVFSTFLSTVFSLIIGYFKGIKCCYCVSFVLFRGKKWICYFRLISIWSRTKSQREKPGPRLNNFELYKKFPNCPWWPSG